MQFEVSLTNTPKALANSSPGFEHKREPWVSNSE